MCEEENGEHIREIRVTKSALKAQENCCRSLAGNFIQRVSNHLHKRRSQKQKKMSESFQKILLRVTTFLEQLIAREF